ncbi:MULTISPECIES: MFS transporter [Pseudomonas]|uniref:Major facilitator family transporter n=2 Tax=Pseudomonas TaxID=286 RepID=A0A267BFF4_PSEFR|nr:MULTISPECIES: MFS transporter [Pseudomonas]MBP3858814.1 MFS transporter [Pseudomonas sp.]MCH4881531.1 MFS transporter [Pseudomonas sp. TMW22080]MQT85049.1 MFS transporter [Pseudomonas sp. FSL R10-2964]MQU54658.1 MFS transporter [Pseudomonas sp. FSL R10-1339]PAA23436.1 MFS transporter [Pseudomonas fragi]
MNTLPPPPADMPDHALHSAYRKTAWRVIPLLMVCYLVAYLDRVNVGFAKLQMLDDLKFSEAVYGLGAGVFFVGYLMFEIPSNIALHRFGARRWIARIMMTWGLLSAAMMFVETPMSFYLLRFLIGIAEAGFFPGIIFYLTTWFPSHRRGVMISLFIAALPISSMLGSLISGLIMQTLDGVAGYAGWQWLFVIEGLPAVALGAAVFFLLRDRIADARWLSAEEKRGMQAALDRETRAKSHHSVRDGLLNPKIWLLGAVYFCLVLGQYVISFWMPTIIRNSGVAEPWAIGVLSAIPYSVAAVSMVLVGRSSDRVREYRWHLAICAFIGAGGVVFGTLFGASLWLSMIGLTVGTAAMISSLPVFWGMPTAVVGGAAAAAGIALINSLGNVAGFFSTIVVGWLTQLTGNTQAAMYFMAAALVLGGLLGLSVSRTRSDPVVEIKAVA